MTDPHRPDPGFVEGLVDRLTAEDRRLARFEPAPYRRRRRFPALTTTAALAVIVLCVGVVAAGKLEEAERKQLLLDRAGIVYDTAVQRQARLEESLTEAKRSYEAGFIGKSTVERASLRVQLQEIEVERLRLERAEIEATGQPPRDDVAAPMVGESDFAGDRLRLDLRGVGIRIEAAKAERRRQLANTASGFGSAEELARTRQTLESKMEDYRARAEAVRAAAEETLRRQGHHADGLRLEVEELRRRIRVSTDEIDEAEMELAVKKPLREKLDGVRAQIRSGFTDITDFGSDEKADSMKDQLAEAELSLSRALRNFGNSHPKVIQGKEEILLLQERLKARLLEYLKLWEADYDRLVSRISSRQVMTGRLEALFRKLSTIKAEYDSSTMESERMEDEANRYRTLLEKLRVAPVPPPAAEPSARSEEDAGWRIALAEMDAEEIRRRLTLRETFLAGKLDAEEAALRESRSEAVRRLEAAKLGLELANAEFTRLKKLHAMGLVTRVELREAEGRVLDRETESRVAEIDIAILDDRLAK